MPTSQHLASLQWKAEEGQEVDERFGSLFFFSNQDYCRSRNTSSPRRPSGGLLQPCCPSRGRTPTGSRRSCWRSTETCWPGWSSAQDPPRRRTDRSGPAKHTDANKRWTQSKSAACETKEDEAFFRLFGPPLHQGAAQLEQNHNCERTLSSRESWRQRGSLFSLSSTAFQKSSFSYHVIYTWTEAATTEHMIQHVYG